MPKDAEVELAQQPWPLAYTASFVEQTRSHLDATSVLVIAGPAGGSRDLLASDVAGIDDRPSPARHVARRGERVLPYFAINQLCLGARPSPTTDLDSVEALLRDRIAEHTWPVRIVLIGAEFCDPESVEILVRLAEKGHLHLIATMTAKALRDQVRLRQAGDVIEVAPFDTPAVAEALRVRFGAEPDPGLVELVLNRTGGSYPFVRQLADTCAAAGVVIVDDGVLTVDNAASADTGSLRLPLRADEPALADLVDVTALLGRIDVVEAQECFGDAAVELASSSGVLSLTDGAIGFTYAAESSPIRRALPLQRQIDLFDRYVDALPVSVSHLGVAPRSADWWRAAGHPLPVDLAARAAHEANLQGRYRRAMVYSDPAYNDENIHIVPMERGFALLALGDIPAFTALMASLDPAELTEDELYVYLFSLTLHGDEKERERLTRRALETDDPASRRRRAAVHTLADLVHRTFMMSGERVASRLRALAFSGQLSPGNRAATFAALSASLCHAARPAEGVQASRFALEILAEAGERTSAFHLDTARALHIVTLVSAVDLVGAEQALREFSAGIFDSAGDGGRLMPALQAYVSMQRGEMAESLASAEHFLAGLGAGDPYQLRGWVEAMAAECLVHLGRTADALASLAAAAQHTSQLPPTDLARRIAMAATRDALAEPEEALEILNEVIDEAARRGLLITRIEAAAAGVMVGGPPQLIRLLDAVADLEAVDAAGTPLTWQTFAQGVRDYDIALIVDLAVQLEAKDARLMAAGVAQFVLDMARRATDLDHDTRAHLTSLADLSGHAAG